MKQYHSIWIKLIQEALENYAKERAIGDLGSIKIVAETPPNPDMGDIAFPMFPLARLFKQSPPLIAEGIQKHLPETPWGKTEIAGPYLNVRLNKFQVQANIIEDIEKQADQFGHTKAFADEKIMLEFSCPNTNKPLHLGHLRNDSLGESVSRILKANGANVQKVNLINDRGVHICKSMLAYLEFGHDSTPETADRKSDHFVGDYYVKFAQWAKENPEAEEKARDMLRAWEKGDSEVQELWKKMNHWAISGIKKTYENTGIHFDTYYYESETYLSGKDEIHRGLIEGKFYKEEDNSIWVDLSDIKLDKKVLLRGDGTSLYITQDIGTAVKRHEDWPFKRLIYVVASEQKYHFQVLFHVLGLLGHDWAKNLYHLSYGMVNLPEGKMKSREGTVVDADNLLEELVNLAKSEINSRERDDEITDIDKTSHSIALGALNYYLLSTTPAKDMIFNPKESISFNGNTGPYLQYTGARICSILRKFDDRKTEFASGRFQAELLTVKEEWEIMKLLASFSDIIEQAGREYNPSYIASYLYDLAKIFSRYYHDNPILHNADANIVVSRIRLVKAIKQAFEKGFYLIGVPFLERM
ncbi:MAG: arginine--tRNA ligase [Spirochaetales bacterium]|nr:arginine--tRNA ligase [Spirochaetales bacterium]